MAGSAPASSKALSRSPLSSHLPFCCRIRRQICNTSAPNFSRCASAIADMFRFGTRFRFFSISLVTGDRVLPQWNHVRMDLRSYVFPSSATHGSTKHSCVIGHTSSRRGAIEAANASRSSSLRNAGQSAQFESISSARETLGVCSRSITGWGWIRMDGRIGWAWMGNR